MTRFYLDPVSGSDAAAGTSWGTARKTTLNLTGVSAGDEISIAKTPECDEVAVTGTFSGTANLTSLTGSASLGCIHVVRAVSSWTAYNSATVATGTGLGSYTPITGTALSAFNGGSLTFPASPATATKYAVMDLGSTQDLSGYVDLSIWLYLSSTGTWTDNHLVIKLCSDAAGDTAVETFNVTLTQMRGVANGTNIHLLKGSALSSTVRSIAFYSGSTAPVASSVIRWSCLMAYPSGATLKCNDWVYAADFSIMGKVTFIDDGSTSTPDIHFGYAAHKNLHDWSGVSIKRRRPWHILYADKTTTVTSMLFPLRFGGTDDTTRVTYKGGYNTGSDTVDGITFLDDSTQPSATNAQWYWFINATYAVNFITLENLWVGGHQGVGGANGATGTTTFNYITTNCASFTYLTTSVQIGTIRPITKWYATDCIFGPGNYYVGNSTTGASTVVDWVLDGCYSFNATMSHGTGNGIAGDVTWTDTTFYLTTMTLQYNNGYGLGGDPTIWWTEYGLRVTSTNSNFKGGMGRLTLSSRDAAINGRWNIAGDITFDTATATMLGRGVWDATTDTLRSWNYLGAGGVFYCFTITGAAAVLTTYNIEVRNVTWTGYTTADQPTWQHADIRACYLEASPGSSYYLINFNHCYVEGCTFKSISPQAGTFFHGHIRLTGSGTSDVTEMRSCDFYSVVPVGCASGGAGGMEVYSCTYHSGTNYTASCGYASYGLRVINPINSGFSGGLGPASDVTGAPWLGPAPGLRHGLCYFENVVHDTYGPVTTLFYDTESEAAIYRVDGTATYQRVPGESSIRVFTYPIPIANVAVVAGKEVTASVWVVRSVATDVGYLKAKPAQLSSDQPEYSTSSSLGGQVWELISLVFTPTTSGMIQFHVQAVGSAWFANFTCTQA